MKSLYGRQFLLTAGMILISFALLGTAFIGLSYQYTIRETRDSMERNADYVADFTAKVRAEGIDVRDMAYQLYVANVAHIANAFVLVTEADGELVLCSDGATIQSGLGGNYLPQSIVSQLQKEGGYSGMTTLGGLFPEKRFVAGTPITVKTVNLATGQTEQTMIGVAYVAAETSDITELWQAFISIFFFTAVVVLCVAFITSSITSLRLTNPLKEIAETARKFGHGEYEVRVQGYEKRKDEVGELAEAFNAMADSIAKSEARRSEFVANISHELKTPMTTIGGFVDGILDGTIPPERQNHYLGLVSNEVKRLSRLVSGMLNVSKIEAGEMTLNTVPFNICEVIFTALLSFEQQIEQKSIEIEGLDVDKVMVEGDRDLVHQVIYNLVDNAVKFVNEGGVISFGFETVGGYTFTAVRNSGEGIPKEQLQQVFDRFYKTDRSRGLDKKGVGLGLYIAKTIVNRHGGDIVVSSKEGEYTEFRFSLPAAKPLRAKRAVKGEGRREGQPADIPAEAEGQQAPDPGDGDRKI